MTTPNLSYPTGDDLKKRIQSTGLIENPPTGAAALIEFDFLMQIVAEEWEKGTGYVPFLADTAESVTPYNSRGIRNGRLSLRGGMVSVSGVSLGGVAYSPGAHFQLLPLNAPQSKRPFKEIEFGGALAYAGYGAGAEILVTGVRGYWPELSAQVREVMLDRGFSLAAPQLALQISGGRGRIGAGKVALGFSNPLSGESATWDRRWNAAILNHRR